MTRVTVTGATGLIGTRVVAALPERGDELTVLHAAYHPGAEEGSAGTVGSGRARKRRNPNESDGDE